MTIEGQPKMTEALLAIPGFLKRHPHPEEPVPQAEAEVIERAPEPEAQTFVPAPPLPEDIERLANATRAGRFAAEAIAREYLATAEDVENHGRLYEAHTRASAAALRALADDMEKDGREKLAKAQEDAGRIRTSARSTLNWIEERSTLSADMGAHFDAIRQRIEQSMPGEK